MGFHHLLPWVLLKLKKNNHRVLLRISIENMVVVAARSPWLAQDVLAVPGVKHNLQKSPKKILPKFDRDKDDTLEDHINKFMLSLCLMTVQHEDVVY